MGHVGVSRGTPDYHALLVLNMVLGGQFVSRVNMKLREEKGGPGRDTGDGGGLGDGTTE